MHLTNRSLFIYGILVLFWAAIIFKLSTMSGIQLPKMEWLMTPDKFGHAGVYGIFTFLLFQIGKNIFQTKRKNIYFASIVAILYGIGMEYVQYAFFPGRYFEYSDIVANIIGVLLSLRIIYYFGNYFNHK